MEEEGSEKKKIVVDVDNIQSYIGHPLYRSSKFYTTLPPPVTFFQ